LKFKIELSLLLSAIILYVVSAYCYSYETLNQTYRDFAFSLVGVASVFVVVAAFLYSRRK
jgi:hypothetical protein